MNAQQNEHLVSACDAILDRDDEDAIAVIIVWSDGSNPTGVGTIILGEDDRRPRQDEVHYVLAENEEEARHIHAVINAAMPRPLILLGH
jgi:hypothetical protein